ncbi:EpsD family peptidyl-prolyl cis-trans isomerase [Herbaspirillum sp. alder98]|uniref:EpsD family peptidyl-prolyl cis-trans isomerase n=1 Tax=Herbaspirillum sp. alder98 TaxID=2913096 RepID=UPI001CD8D1F1|nr:EpsD family peptidyl-prolyl cis-trans isomerase [Herbaspirillum sp. alder98]MCA1322664.1 EpsD family peptidyl-prolyl cis-trans isomerase [Herbaspirillum sp. alder98]
MRKPKLSRGLIFAGVLLALAGCGEKSKDSSQSLVRINGSEITIHQLNAEVKTSPNLPMSTLLEALINRQLLVDAAKKAKLDEDPAVLAELQKARDTVLAQAYVGSRTGNVTPPSEQEIAQFYKDSPDSFGQRRQYEFNELIIEPSAMTPEIEKFMTGKKSIDEVANFLNTQRVPFRRETVNRFSSELPPVMATSLRTMELGTLFVVKEAGQTLLVSLADSKSIPLGANAAAPQIRQLLTAQKYTEQVNAQITPLRSAAKIEYLARGEAILKAAPAAASPAAGAAGKKADDGHIQRGVAGLK